MAADQASCATADRRGWVLVPVLMALIGLWLFAFAYEGAPVVPTEDGWTWIAHAKAFSDDGLAGLTRGEHPLLHGQHLYLLPSLIALIVGPLVDYSFRPFAFLCVIAVVLCGVVFYRLARASGLGRIEALLVFLAVTSFRHYENLFSGFQLGFPLCVLLGSLAVIVADTRRDRRGFAIASVLALGSALSSSAGFMTCITIPLVRWFEPLRPRNWIIAGLAAAAALLLLHFALTGLGLMETSVVAYGMQQLNWSTLPVMFEDGVNLVGGGLVNSTTSGPAGLALLAGASAVFVTQALRTQRIDALCGLIPLSLFYLSTITVARSPIGNPCSRYAIFAAPLVAACTVGLFQLVGSHGAELRAAANAALSVGLVWLYSHAARESSVYRRALDGGELATRTLLARIATGSRLTEEEVAKVIPGPPDYIRGLLDYTLDRRLTIFSPHYHGLEVHGELPTRAHEVTQTKQENGAVSFAGPGYLYNSYACEFPSGCTAWLSVDLAVKGQATIGILVRRADGTEKQNFNVLIPAGETVARWSVSGEADAGDKVEPYVFSFGPDDVVRFERFSFVLLQRAHGP